MTYRILQGDCIDRCRRLEAALRFYANEASYRQASPGTGPFSTGSALPIHGDLGERARAALREEDDAT
jgi:hypothetical protein